MAQFGSDYTEIVDGEAMRLKEELRVANGLLLRAWVQLEHKDYADDHPLIVQIKKHLKVASIKECLDRYEEVMGSVDKGEERR